MTKATNRTTNSLVKICVLCVVLSVAVSAHAVPIYNAATDHYYDRIDAAPGDGYTWVAAKTAAEGMSHFGVQGYLATVTSEGENNFIIGNLSRPETGLVRYWLGGYQESGSSEPDEGWAWITGESWSYSNWASGEPDNNNSENVLTYWYSGNWNDFRNDNTSGNEFNPPILLQNGFVVEYPVPEPMTLILLGLGGLGLLRRKRN